MGTCSVCARMCARGGGVAVRRILSTQRGKRGDCDSEHCTVLDGTSQRPGAAAIRPMDARQHKQSGVAHGRRRDGQRRRRRAELGRRRDADADADGTERLSAAGAATRPETGGIGRTEHADRCALGRELGRDGRKLPICSRWDDVRIGRHRSEGARGTHGLAKARAVLPTGMHQPVVSGWLLPGTDGCGVSVDGGRCVPRSDETAAVRAMPRSDR